MRMLKRILFAVPQLTDGGAERVVSVWANELSAKGYDVSILVASVSNEDYYTNEKVKVIAMAQNLEQYKGMSGGQRYQWLRRFLKEIRPDYIIPFLPAMQVWMMLCSWGLPVRRIETIRVNPWKISVSKGVKKMVWRICFKSCYKIILQASDQAPFFSLREQKKCVLVPNPISEIFIDNYKACLSERPTEFIAAGRVAPQKNYAMMIKAFGLVCKKHTDLRLRIFGAGTPEYTARMQRIIDEEGLGDHVFLMGRTKHIEEEYKKSDFYLMTSDFEGLPNALMEAMASRLVCISTDCKTGLRDLIDDGVNGCLVPMGDETALAQRIEDVLAMSAQERERMADAARTKIMTYCSRENSVEKLCELFE